MASKIVPIALVSVLVCLVQSKVGVEATTNYTSIAIVGNVYCRCKFAGYDSNVGGTPEKGDVVHVSCPNQNSQCATEHYNITNDSGYFYINWPEVDIFDPSQCKAYLDLNKSVVTLARPFCSKPYYTGGADGAALSLVAEKPIYGGIQGIYSPGALRCGPPAENLDCPFN